MFLRIIVNINSNTMRISVLVATYNGELYVKKLLNSLLSQTVDAEVIVRDDGSVDSTLDIVRSYGPKLRVLQDDLGNVGVINNFNLLMAATDAPYVAFSDQDDIWMRDKLALQMEVMLRLEEQYGTETPILVHSDLVVCDVFDRVLAPSLWRFQRLDPNVCQFSRILVQNNITGCTMMINKALQKLAFPVPSQAVMHDWWLALVASAAGKIGFVSSPLVRYRQHERNQLGAVSGGGRAVLRLGSVNPAESLRAAQAQAGVFAERFSFHPEMANAVRMAHAYFNIRSYNYFFRIWTLYKYCFWKQEWLKNIGLVVFI